MNTRSYKTISIALALIVFHPTCVISREVSAKELLIGYLSVMLCLKDEGIVTREKAYINVIRMLEMDGISKDRILNLMQDPSIQEGVRQSVQSAGGCVNIGKGYEKYFK